MLPDLETFLGGLFARCAPAAYLTLSAIFPGGACPTPSRHISLADQAGLAEALDRLLTANRQGWGAYFAVATRRSDLGRWRRGGRTDLAELPALFLDLDEPDRALIRLDDFALPPSCVVRSSAGRTHAYWWLTSPIPVRDMLLADRALRGLAQHLGGGPRMTVASSLRLPSSVNTKAGRDGALCRLETIHPERRYDLADFGSYLAPLPLPIRRSASSGEPDLALSRDGRAQLIQEVTRCLIRDYGGVLKRTGWLGALCPYGHTRDRPGQHFFYHPASGGSRCFGRHGVSSLPSLCRQIGIDLPEMRFAC